MTISKMDFLENSVAFEPELLVENRPLTSVEEQLVVNYIQNYQVSKAEKRQLHAVLKDIFAQSPIPNRLKKPKQDWMAGKLGFSGAIRIVEEYSNYQVEIFCVPKIA